MTIAISHEVPISLFERSLSFNDYDYALVHLFEKYPAYYDFFYRSVHKRNRTVLLDNSAYELQHKDGSYDMDNFASWIEKLQPTEYIIPDKFNDMETTIQNAEHWVKIYDLPGIKIGVIQGENLREFAACYRAIEPLVDKVALSFGLACYQQIGSSGDQYMEASEKMMNGRISVIYHLLERGLINFNKSHHLLGCSRPIEFAYYRNFDWITSLDTSSPILHAIESTRYKPWGVAHKPKVTIEQVLTNPYGEDVINLVNYNVNMFRHIVGE